jgi:hypothetical protein
VTAAIIDARDRFNAARCLATISEEGVAIRARNAARAAGASWAAERCADLALAKVRMGATAAEAIAAARAHAIALAADRSGGGAA